MHIFKKVHVYVLRQSIHVDSNSYKLTSIYINNIVLFDNIRKKTILKYNLHSAHNIDYQNGTSEPFMYCCPILPSIYGVVATGLRLAINSAYFIWSLLYIYKEIYFDSYLFYSVLILSMHRWSNAYSLLFITNFWLCTFDRPNSELTWLFAKFLFKWIFFRTIVISIKRKSSFLNNNKIYTI